MCERRNLEVSVGEIKILRFNLSGEREPLIVTGVSGTRGSEGFQNLGSFVAEDGR